MKRFFTKFILLLFCAVCVTLSTNAQGGADCASSVAVTTTGCMTTTTSEPGGWNSGGISNTCFATGGSNAVWYSYVAPANGTIDVESISSNDTRLSILDGTCGALNCVDSDDDDGPSGGFSSFVDDAPVVAGTTYYIEWDDRWSSAAFDWTISFACNTPTAPTVTVPSSGSLEVTYSGEATHIEYGVAGFTQGTGTLVAVTGSPQTITDAIIADCGTMEVYIINDCLSTPSCAIPSTVASVNTVCPCTDPTGITATDISVCGGVIGVDVSWTSAGAPDNYEVEIGTAGFTAGTGTEAGAMTVIGGVMTSFNSLTPGISYDVYVRHNCGGGAFSPWIGPVSVTTGGVMGANCDCSIPVTTTGCAATTTSEPGGWNSGGISNTCFATGGSNAAWYSYVAPANGTIDVESISGNDTRLSILGGVCGALTCVDSDDDDGPSGGFSSFVDNAPVVAGTTYYIEWDDRWSSAAFDWTISFACNTPTAPTVTAPSSGSLEVTYSGEATHIEYGVAGFTQGTGTLVAVTGSPQTITDAIIADCGTMEVYIINDCLSTPSCGVPSTVASVNTVCPCTDPTGITATDISVCGGVIGVDVSWTSAGAPDNYEVEIGTAGFTAGTGTEAGAMTVTGGVMTSFNSLTPGVSYDVYVRHDCGGGAFSPWIGPASVTTGGVMGANCDCPTPVTTTGCAATTTSEPGGWNSGGISNACFATGGSNSVWYSYVAPANGTIDVESISGNDTRLSILEGTCGALTCVDSDDDDGPSGGFSSFVDDAPVVAGTTYYIEWDDRWSSAAFDWTIAFTCSAPVAATGTASVSGSVDISYTGDVTHIEYGATGFTQGAGTVVAVTGSPMTITDAIITDCGTIDVYLLNDCVGDVACQGVSPVATINTFCPCGDPTAIMATDASVCGGAIGVDVSWTSGGAPDDYQVEIGLTGFAPGTGAEVAATTTTGAVMASFTGLTAGTAYDVYVRHDCGTGFSVWNGPIAVTTGGVMGVCDCPIVVTTTGCATTTTSEPGGWNSGGISNACFATGGSNSVWYSYVAPANGTIDVESISGNDTRLSILEGTCGALTCVDSDDDDGPSGGFSSFVDDAPVVAGNTYYIEWDDRWSNAAFDWTIAFTCSAPVAATGTASVSGSVDISYTGDVTHIEYGATGFTQGTGTVVAVTGSPMTITDAAFADCSMIDVYLLNDCMGDVTCQGVSPVSTISTVCCGAAAVALPTMGTATTLVAVNNCDDGPWTYYENPNVAGEYLFAIQWDPAATGTNAAAKLAAVVTIDVLTGSTDVTDANGGSFAMARYWNVDLMGTTIDVANPVNVKFYYDPAEEADVIADATAQAMITPSYNDFMWFKTVSGVYDESQVTATDFQGTVQLLPVANAGTENSITFVQFDGLTSFSGGTGAAGAGAGFLPIELASFTGQAMDNYNMLEWTTASEENTRMHVIERSLNGTADFREIGSVEAAGNSQSDIRYTLNDENPGTLGYYRLKTIDLDGSVQYSNVISIQRKGDIFEVVNTYPVPTTKDVTVEFVTAQDEEVIYTITDITGKVVMHNVFEAEKGLNKQVIDMANMSNGVYFLTLQNSTSRVIKNIVKN